MLSRAEQERNAPASMLVTESELSTCSKRSSQKQIKVSTAKFVTEVGNLMLARAKQDRKASLPMLVTITGDTHVSKRNTHEMQQPTRWSRSRESSCFQGQRRKGIVSPR